MKLFALNSSKTFGELVAKHLGLPLGKHEETEFEDGEHESRPLESVRNEDVYVIQSLYADKHLSINDKLCRLLFFIGALKDASARKVIAVVPYLCYARKDQKSEPGGPVTTRYVAALFETVGADQVLTIDIHNISAFQNAFRCATENLEAKKIFIDHLVPIIAGKDIVIMSPDVGGVKRAELFQKALNKRIQKEFSLVFKEKYRKAGVVTGETIVGDVKGKTVIIIDDMISTGTTIARSVTACKSAGAKGVIAVVTHGIFSGRAWEVLNEEGLDHIVITNTIPPLNLENRELMNKITVLDVTPLFSAAIERIQEGGSITALLND
ncbi:ribose-phosphate diphosphokinase [Segetibacter koreensis]|uniref:ribose-phosphate diphosphokinase n=1 Tax=Segetibacter koreensis TaxID=398037 RepID=UPI000368B6BA|nr:ribose-phosphate pyrophosphokinase [Segetibacter koreensis]